MAENEEKKNLQENEEQKNTENNEVNEVKTEKEEAKFTLVEGDAVSFMVCGKEVTLKSRESYRHRE